MFAEIKSSGVQGTDYVSEQGFLFMSHVEMIHLTLSTDFLCIAIRGNRLGRFSEIANFDALNPPRTSRKFPDLFNDDCVEEANFGYLWRLWNSVGFRLNEPTAIPTYFPQGLENILHVVRDGFCFYNWLKLRVFTTTCVAALPGWEARPGSTSRPSNQLFVLP